MGETRSDMLRRKAPWSAVNVTLYVTMTHRQCERAVIGGATDLASEPSNDLGWRCRRQFSHEAITVGYYYTLLLPHLISVQLQQ